MNRIIHIHAQAPAKPAWGQPCNGCGVCCLLEPCPVGIVLSGRRHGACRAVQWSPDQQRYFCGALLRARQVPLAGGALAAILARWIAASQGCDADIELES